MKELRGMNKNAILWESDIFNNILKLSKNGEKHNFEKLNNSLKEAVIPESIKVVTFLPSSHMGTKLEETSIALNYKMIKIEKNKFSIADLHEVIRENSMRGHPENITKKVAEGILKIGEKHNIFKICGEESGIKYYILGLRPHNVKRKYILNIARKNAKNNLAKELEIKIKDRIPPKDGSIKKYIR